MGILMGIGLKMAAQKLLSSAFTRSSSDLPAQEKLDEYRELDEKFEPEELPTKPNLEMTPKEQFMNSLGDRGLDLNPEQSSLYDRLTEDMKVVVDSNYEVADNIGKRLDYVEDLVKATDHNARLASEVAATYGKMNQEAVIGSGSKSGSKVMNFLKGILNGAKDAIMLAIAGIASTANKTFKYLKGEQAFEGEEGANEELDKTVEDNANAQKEAQQVVSESQKELEEVTQKTTSAYEDLGNMLSSEQINPLISQFDSFKNSSEYSDELSGIEGFNAMTKFMGAEEGSLNRNLTDEEKAEAYNKVRDLRTLENTQTKVAQTVFNAQKEYDELVSVGDSLKASRGMATFRSIGFSKLKEEIDSLEKEASKKPALERYKDYKDIAEKKRDAVALFSDEQLESMNIRRGSNPLETYEEIVKAFDKTSSAISKDSNSLPVYFNRLTSDSRTSRDKIVEAIQSGDISMYDSEGNKIDPSKTDIGKIFSAQSGYGASNIYDYSFKNSLTGDTVVSNDIAESKSFEKLKSEESDISDLRSTLNNLGVSVDDIKNMSNSEFKEFSSKISSDNDTIMYMLGQIWRNSNNQNTTVVVTTPGSGMDPE